MQNQVTNAKPPEGIPPSRNGRRNRIVLTILGIFAVAGAAYAVYWGMAGQYVVSTDNAYVTGNLISVSPQITATVVTIYADDTDRVSQGQVLVQLDDTDTRLELEQAKAKLAESIRQVRQMYERVGQLRQLVTARQAELTNAEQDLTRRRRLAEQKLVTPEEVQHSHNTYTSAVAALNATKHDLQAASALVQGTDIEQHPLVMGAEAHLRAVFVEWQRHRIVAPVSGYIAKRSVQIGQRVTTGTPLMTIVPLDQVWVEANYKEDQLVNLRLGQPVRLRADIYGSSVQYHGNVTGLGTGTGASFALLPPQNASGNWIKIVQRVPVRIKLDSEELAAHPLRVGLSMQVAVDTHRRDGPILAQSPVAGVRYQTSVYDVDNAEVKSLIAGIIKANRGNAVGSHE